MCSHHPMRQAPKGPSMRPAQIRETSDLDIRQREDPRPGHRRCDRDSRGQSNPVGDAFRSVILGSVLPWRPARIRASVWVSSAPENAPPSIRTKRAPGRPAANRPQRAPPASTRWVVPVTYRPDDLTRYSNASVMSSLSTAATFSRFSVSAAFSKSARVGSSRSGRKSR